MELFVLEEYLEDFLEYANPESCVNSYPWQYYYQGGDFTFHLVISAIIHGNEYGSLPAILEIIQKLEGGEIHFGGQITIVLGNPEAARANVRFLQSDLNRMFLSNDKNTHEAQRARVLMLIFDQADLLIDFHQTILQTEKAFYICPLTDEVLCWAKALQCTNAIVDATPTNTNTATTRCADDYMYLRKKPAVTIELSKKGVCESATKITLDACYNVLKAITEIQNGSRLEDVSNAKPDVAIYTTIHREPYRSREYRLKPNLYNFTPVHCGEHLEASNSKEIIVPFDGYLLFPKYPEDGIPLPNHIFRIIQKS
jgi:succinylglutamate desuccinylase